LGANDDERDGVPTQLTIDKTFYKNAGVRRRFGNDDVPIAAIQDIGRAPTVIEPAPDFQRNAAVRANVCCVDIGLDFDPTNLGIELT
jgi:hypothetical protein